MSSTSSNAMESEKNKKGPLTFSVSPDTVKTTPLHFVKTLKEAKRLVAEGVDIHAKDKFGRTCLHTIWNTPLEIVKFFVEQGADVNATDNSGSVPLHCTGDNVEVFKYLVYQGTDVNNTGFRGRTLLHHDRDLEIVKFLVARGLDVNAKDDDGLTPLAFVKDVEVAKFLVGHGADVNVTGRPVSTTGEQSPSLLFTAPTPELAEFYISHGHDVLVKNKDKYNNTPMHFVKSVKMAKFFIDKGFHVDDKNDYGVTPLYNACSNYNIDLIKFLIANGADVHVKTTNNESLLNRPKNLEVIKILVDYGVDVNGADDNGITPLFHASQTLGLDKIKFLVEKGANVNAKNSKGRTPLFHAARTGFADAVLFLIEECGADPAVVDNDGKQALHYSSNPKIVIPLVKKIRESMDLSIEAFHY